MQRASISKKLRFDVFKRDRFQCAYCGAHPSETVLLEIDHIRPVADGGTDEMDNLVTACFNCNRGKGAEPLTSVPQSLEEKADEVAEHEAQLRAFYEVLAAKKKRRDDELWEIANHYMDAYGESRILRSYMASIRKFIDLLNFYEVQEAMELACNRMDDCHSAFRYFCGVCWNKIKAASGER